MSRLVHLRVVGLFGGARPEPATITIDRAAGTFGVRVYKRRRVDTFYLPALAEYVVRRSLVAEANARAAAKRARRGRRVA